MLSPLFNLLIFPLVAGLFDQSKSKLKSFSICLCTPWVDTMGKYLMFIGSLAESQRDILYQQLISSCCLPPKEVSNWSHSMLVPPVSVIILVMVSLIFAYCVYHFFVTCLIQFFFLPVLGHSLCLAIKDSGFESWLVLPKHVDLGNLFSIIPCHSWNYSWSLSLHF